MKPRTPIAPRLLLLVLSVGLLTFSTFKFPSTHAQGQVQVNAADPMSAEQGTINLNVKVTGKGFKNGAQAKWFVTGTTNPGGVTVNSTSFVSSTELTANITVDEAASIADFDIQVLNSDGRGGKGTELFRVVEKNNGNTQCPVLAPPQVTDSKCYANLPGCLDGTFGGLGYLHSPLANPSRPSSLRSLVIQPDGKIVVGGYSSKPSATNSDFAITRFNTDGSLDTSFGDMDPLNGTLRLGYTITEITTETDIIYGMAQQPDGKFVAVGTAGASDKGVVVRYNNNGTLDTSFGSGGKTLLNFAKGIPNQGLALQSDGKIVVVGYAVGSGSNFSSGFSVARLLANGSPDLSFGTGGLAVANASGTKNGSGNAVSVVVQRVPALTGEERIVLGGWSSISSSANHQWTLMRFKPNGTADSSFGTAGIVKTPFLGFGDNISRLQIDANNRIVAGGGTRTADSSCGPFIDSAVTRYLENGSLDASFGGGKQTVDVYGGLDHLNGLVTQPDGKILIVGDAFNSDGSTTDVALIRFNSNGSRDTTFGLLGNGIVTSDYFGDDDTPIGGVALQPSDGKIVVAGSTRVSTGTNIQLFVARYLP